MAFRAVLTSALILSGAEPDANNCEAATASKVRDRLA